MTPNHPGTNCFSLYSRRVLRDEKSVMHILWTAGPLSMTWRHHVLPCNVIMTSQSVFDFHPRALYFMILASMKLKWPYHLTSYALHFPHDVFHPLRTQDPAYTTSCVGRDGHIFEIKVHCFNINDINIRDQWWCLV
jgi:hypothetical protein